MSVTRRASIGILFACTLLLAPKAAVADEGGVSFWIPGFFGSLAATPQQPGWSWATVYYHTSVSAGADVAFARQVTAGNLAVNFNGRLNASLKGDADLGFFLPNYVFETPVLGGQAAVSLLGAFGRSQASVDATLTAALGPLGFAVSGGRSDSVTGFGDLAPFFSLRWNHGVDNWMVYATGDVPVGAYNPRRLANLGIGHGAVDAGGGYTYFDEQKGHELSAVLGFTYNLENTITQYKNGIDMHLDWGASQFLTKEWQVGLVGYVYNQVSCDSGSGDRVGCFESRVFGVGPQVGHIFEIDEDLQGYVNLKGYGEFQSEHRPAGWNVWLTFSVSPAPKKKSAEQKSSMQKSAMQKAAEQKSAMQMSTGQMSAEQMSTEEKSAKQKAAEQKSAESKRKAAAKLPVKAPPPPAQVFTWSGFYFGPHLGGGWAEGKAQSVSGPGPGFFDPFRTNLNASGVVGGAQVGFNWQFESSWVIGLEGDISGAQIDRTATLSPATLQGVPLAPFSSLTLTRNVNWLASVRGRIGYAWDRTLLYVTGGGAWANIRLEGALVRPVPLPRIFVVGIGDTQTGWVVGGGFEYAFEDSNWTIRGEFLHYQFDGFSADSLPFNGFTARDTVGNFDVNVGRVGFNYKLGEPSKVTARY